MSALTTQTKMLGSNAIIDPKVAYPGLVSFSTRINFAEAPLDGNSKRVAASTNYDLMEIPKGFVLQNVLLKELAFGRDGTERCASGTITLKTKSDSGTFGSAVTVGGDTLAKAFCAIPADVDITETKTGDVHVSTAKAEWTGTDAMKLLTGVSGSVDAGGGKAFASGDMLCFVASVAMATGGIEVIITGYFPDGEDTRYSPTRTVPYRKIGNTTRNVAEPDRLLGR